MGRLRVDRPRHLPQSRVPSGTRSGEDRENHVKEEVVVPNDESHPPRLPIHPGPTDLGENILAMALMEGGQQIPGLE